MTALKPNIFFTYFKVTIKWGLQVLIIYLFIHFCLNINGFRFNSKRAVSPRGDQEKKIRVAGWNSGTKLLQIKPFWSQAWNGKIL